VRVWGAESEGDRGGRKRPATKESDARALGEGPKERDAFLSQRGASPSLAPPSVQYSLRFPRPPCRRRRRRRRRWWPPNSPLLSSAHSCWRARKRPFWSEDVLTRARWLAFEDGFGREDSLPDGPAKRAVNGASEDDDESVLALPISVHIVPRSPLEAGLTFQGERKKAARRESEPG